MLLALAVATTACGSHDRSSPLVQKANAFCQREDAKIAKAEGIAPGVWFTANTVSHIQAEAEGLARLGLLGKLAPSFIDWGRARALLIRSYDLRKPDMWLLRAKAAAASEGIHCSFGARPLSGL